MKKRRAFYLQGLLLLTLLLAVSCQRQARGFVLPEGNSEKGAKLFADLHCNDCHSIGAIAWAGSKDTGIPHVPLGGKVTALKTYGELVTSVIHPSHKISSVYRERIGSTLPGGRSRMEQYNYNEAMTVQELIDIVAFLQSEYEIVVPEGYYTDH
jgi:mono/diheme cytochrome c family protein